MANNRKRQNLDEMILPNLPEEVWCNVFKRLPQESRKNATITCKLWFGIIRRDSGFSGNISIPWSELQSSNFEWDNWPSLKTIEVTDSSFPSSEMALVAMKNIEFKKCESLQKVFLSVNCDISELSTAITTKGLLISEEEGEAVKQVRWVVVGDESSQGFRNPPEFSDLPTALEYTLFDQMLKNCGTSLEKLTLKNDCRISLYFFNRLCKSLSENCPNVWYLNLGATDLGLAMEHFNIGLIQKKIKKLKKCQISYVEENLQWFIWNCDSKEYASEVAKALDETYANKPTEFKVHIRANDGKCFQIIKMPFQNSVVTRLED